MRSHLVTILSLVTCLVLALCIGTAPAEEANADFLGKPFPDFTVTDTEGNTFTLSEALKDHEAVVINLWATWCAPCGREFPFLNEAYAKYGDRVSFIALSVEREDTAEKIAGYREERGISLPMGRDESGLFRYIHGTGIPATIVVDRFGNAVFYHARAFASGKQVERVLDMFLGDGYTETTVLKEIPRETSTQAFPVSAARAVYPDSGNFKKIMIYSDAFSKPVGGYIVEEDPVRLRIEVAADDDVANMVFVDGFQEKNLETVNLLDPERGVYTYDQRMPGPSDKQAYASVALYENSATETSDKSVTVLLFRDEESVGKLMDEIKAAGYEGSRWEYAEADEKAENKPRIYIVHVLDQNNNPVREVSVNFCTDTSCTLKESDWNGTITFTGDPDVYHVTIVDAPDGYSWDEDYELYTPREYGEWVLRVRKD